jgi:hypothetical protein
VCNLRPEVYDLLHSSGLSPDSLNRSIIHLQRNCSFYPLWDNTNYSYFVHGLYDLSSKLPKEKRINLYPSDISFDWSTTDDMKLKEFWTNLEYRDSLIALNVIRTLDSLRSSGAAR